jgi:hypothetical protein
MIRAAAMAEARRRAQERGLAQMSEPYMGMLQRRLREPSLATNVKLARALGVSPGALVD